MSSLWFLEIICLKCLQKEPTRRYLSAEMLADDLARFSRGDSIIARPVGRVERFFRWCRRHPAVAALSITLVLALTAALAGTFWQWRAAESQRQTADSLADMYRNERNRARQAQQLAQASLLEAQRHQAAAESRFRKAEAPIQELIRLGTELVRQPGMEQRGRAALERATQFRQALLAEDFDHARQRLLTAATLRMLGWTLLEQGQFAEAEQTYEQALGLLEVDRDVPAENAEALRLASRIFIELAANCSRQGRPADAERNCREGVTRAEQIVARDPDSPADRDHLSSALANWASHLAATEQPQQARLALQRALQNQRQLLAESPNQPLYSLSLALILEPLSHYEWPSDPARARQLATEALDIRRQAHSRATRPRDEAMYLIRSLQQLAAWHRQSGDWPAAKDLLDEALLVAHDARRNFPGFYGTRELLPRVQLAACGLAADQDDWDRAWQLLDAAGDFPDDLPLKLRQALTGYERGKLLARQGDRVAALERMLESLRALRALRASLPEPPDTAEETAVAANSSVATAAGGVVASALAIGGRFEWEKQKIEACRLWSEIAPDNPRALNALAWRQSCSRDPDTLDPSAAEQAVRRALELTPENADFLNTLGVVLFRQDKWEDALRAFEASQQRMPAAPASDWYHLGMIHQRLGQSDLARDFVERARAWHREHAANDPELHLALEQATLLLGPLDDSPTSADPSASRDVGSKPD